MYVVTPRCAAAAAVVSAVVLRRPTKEYTQPYSMMHRRLPTAGIEVAPHYHQLVVRATFPFIMQVRALCAQTHCRPGQPSVMGGEEVWQNMLLLYVLLSYTVSSCV